MGVFTEVFLLHLLGILTALTVIVYAYFKWSYQYWNRRNVPSFEASMPFGTFQSQVKQSVSFGKELLDIYQKAKANGWKHYGVYIFSTPVYIPVDLGLIRNLMTKDFQHFPDRGMYTNERDEPIGCHLVTIGGQKWRNLRAKLTPTFSSGKLKMMFQTLVDCGLVLEKYFAESVENRTAVDIRDVLGRFTTDIIGSCAFGIDCNTFEEPNSPFRVYGKKIFNQTKFELLKASFAINYPNLARALRVRHHQKSIEDFFTKVVEDTVAYREKKNIERKDFLQLLIDIKNNKESQENRYKGDGKTLTMQEVVAQSYVFFIAGFETSSTTMTFALYHLATHPEIQEKVREEIKTVLAKHDNQITYSSINDMKYMGQVLDETLRICPPVPITFRLCVEDYKVPGEDVIIEKNTRVVIPILPIHHDEEYYKNPEVFDPNRFSKENKKLRHPYAHIPFGEGPRICIGLRFGLMQSKVGLTCILRNYRVTLNEKTAVPLKLNFGSAVLNADSGIWVNLEKL